MVNVEGGGRGETLDDEDDCVRGGARKLSFTPEDSINPTGTNFYILCLLISVTAVKMIAKISR